MCETKVKIKYHLPLPIIISYKITKGINKMKNMIRLVLATTIAGLSISCSSTYHAGNTDDVYYSSKNQPSTASTPSAVPASSTPSPDSYSNSNSNYSPDYQNSNTGNQDQSQNNNGGSSDQYSDSKGNTYVTNNYYDDYYDYEYSSRIRRYYSPAYGYGYYDPFYTNSYWYDYNPNSWGVSIYLGYNWWAPSSYYYQPFCYGSGFSVGFGYNSFYPYSSYPYYGGFGYGNPFYHGYQNGYWNGYNNGFYDGYYAGNTNPYYFNSYDATSYYYGPRGSSGSNSPRSATQRQSTIAPISEKFERAVADGRVPKAQRELPESRPNLQQNSSAPPVQRNAPSINNSRTNPQMDNRNINSGRNSTDQGIQQRNNSIDSKGRIIDQSGIIRNDNSTRNNNPRNNNTPSINSRDNQMPARENNGGKINQERNNNIDARPGYNHDNRSNQYEQANPGSGGIQKGNERNNDIKIEPGSRNQEYQPRQERIEAPQRQENRTPIFQPRNEPKQYRMESAPQRSQPSPSPGNSGGRRR
jgi:hypothetical protein